MNDTFQSTCRLPNFFIAGAPKAGTTSLYHYLRQHPQIYMSPIKEPVYFSLELRLENFGPDMQELTRRDSPSLREFLDGPMTTERFGGPVTEWEDYLKLFQGVREEIAVGEASVVYLWSETAPQRIAERLPDAKILIMLRDPTERAFSHYLQARGYGITRGTFREYIDADLKRHSNAFTFRHPFLAFGSYYEQLKRYRAVFSERNIGVFFYEDYHRNAPGVLRQIFKFLSVDPEFLPDMKLRHLEPRVLRFEATRSVMTSDGRWQHLRKILPPQLRRALRPLLIQRRSELQIEPPDRALLVEYYRDDIQKTAQLLDRDLSAWLASPAPNSSSTK